MKDKMLSIVTKNKNKPDIDTYTSLDEPD